MTFHQIENELVMWVEVEKEHTSMGEAEKQETQLDDSILKEGRIQWWKGTGWAWV